jgi:alkyl hydroperoxide reductase subunit AhpF
MSLLQDEDVAFLKENFAQLAHDVTLSVVVRERSSLILSGAEPRDDEEADASDDVKQICTELAATSERIKLEIIDAKSERARELAGDHAPAIVMSSTAAKGRLRYYGLPAGYEMSTLVAAIIDLGAPEDDEGLPEEAAARIGAIAGDVHIQVFVTPS